MNSSDKITGHEIREAVVDELAKMSNSDLMFGKIPEGLSVTDVSKEILRRIESEDPPESDAPDYITQADIEAMASELHWPILSALEKVANGVVVDAGVLVGELAALALASSPVRAELARLKAENERLRGAAFVASCLLIDAVPLVRRGNMSWHQAEAIADNLAAAKRELDEALQQKMEQPK